MLGMKAPAAAKLFAVFVLMSPALLGQSTGSSAQAGKPATATASQESSAKNQYDPSSYTYLGAEVCETCHEDIYKGWEKTPHWKTTLDTKGGPSHQGCEGCHGPGSAHVAGGGDITKIFKFEEASSKEIIARCLTCHAGGQQHMNALNSVHTENGVSCITCHSPHHAETREFLLVKAQPKLCYSCHLQQKPQFEMPFHHRVNEGLIQCTDCHNPHGTVKPKQVQTSSTQNAICFKCHTEKEGPFVFEHPPVKIEGCQSCHVPHGGANMHMLRVSNVNLLCLQCHTNSSFSGATNTPSFHNQQTYFQACTQCHLQIHGSNFDPTFFK